MSNGFAGRSAGVGYSGEVGYTQAWLDADAFWTDMARLKTVTEALESAGTLAFSGADTDFKLSEYLDAMFDGASAVNGVLSFDAFPIDTERFILKAADNPEGPFDEFASVYPEAGQHHYEYELPPNMTWGQVCEVETDGDFLIHTQVRDRKEVTPLELSPIPSFEELSAWHAAHGASSKNAAATQWGENKVLLTITTTEWRDYVWDNVNLYWQNQHGFETYIETINHDPAREPQEHDALQGYLRDTVIKDHYDYAQAAGKTLVVHLVGGKNDWVMWSDLQSWPPEWQDKYDDYIANGYPVGGYPHRDFVPGWYSSRTGSPGNNSGGWVPWISSDVKQRHRNTAI